jgi:outer membrane protein OmpA-like peptidoglycan-associated protein
MKKDELTKEISLINKTTLFDNPILRHYLKKNKLSDTDAVVLGILLELTGQGKIEIRTHYNILAEYAELTAMEVYQSINSLHRYRIIEYKPAGNFVHISFNKIDEKIEEIALAYINAGKIKHLEKDVEFMKRMNYIPAADLFDLITPIIGKIIARKVADALRALVNYINDRLESTMSMRMWKYRFLSLRTGLPIGEIILRESLPCVLDEILIIEKKTSLLLAQGSRLEKSEADRDLVVAMLSAITDFIRTSFDKKNSELNEISFGDSKIILFENIYFYSAVVVHGSPDLEFRNSVDSLLSGIHLKYRDALKNFKGSMEGLQGIPVLIDEFIHSSNAVTYPGGPGERSFRKLKFAAGVLSALSVFFIVMFTINQIKDYRLEKRIVSKINDILPLYSHDIICDVEGDTFIIEGVISSPKTGEEIDRVVSEFPEIKNILNKTVSADFRTVEKFKQELAQFDKRFNDLQILLIRQELEKIIIQFPSGVTAIGSSQILQTRKIYEILKEYPGIDVDIIAFNDPAGGYDVNKRLAEGRMAAIKKYLVSLGMDGERIAITDFNPDIISADPRFSGFKDTRGIMLFAKQSKD